MTYIHIWCDNAHFATDQLSSQTVLLQKSFDTIHSRDGTHQTEAKFCGYLTPPDLTTHVQLCCQLPSADVSSGSVYCHDTGRWLCGKVGQARRAEKSGVTVDSSENH